MVASAELLVLHWVGQCWEADSQRAMERLEARAKQEPEHCQPC